MSTFQKKILSIPIAIALLVLFIGTIWKVQHWPFGLELKLAGLIALGTLYSVRYMYKKPVGIKDTAKVIMVVTWTALNALALYKIYGIFYLGPVLAVSGVVWLVLEISDGVKGRWSAANYVQMLGMLVLILEVLFKIQHWPFGGIMHIFGIFALLLIAMGFVLDGLKLSAKEKR